LRKAQIFRYLENLALLAVIAISTVVAVAFILSVIEDFALFKILVCLWFVLLLMSIGLKRGN